MKRINALPVLLLMLTLATGAQAQHLNQARGFQPNGVYSTNDIDNINLMNGNLTLTIPIGNTYQTSGGFSYSLHLVYNSNLWRTIEYCPAEVDVSTAFFTGWNFYKNSYDGNGNTYFVSDRVDSLIHTENDPGARLGARVSDHCIPVSVPNPDNNAGLGWGLSLGHLLLPGVYGALDARQADSHNYVYQTPDGSERKFYKRLHETDPLEPGETAGDTDATNDDVSYTRDGSYLRMKKVGATQRDIGFPDGSTHEFKLVGNEWRLARMVDQFGNFLSVSYVDADFDGVTDWVLTDSTGRSQVIYFQNLPGVTSTPNVSPSVVRRVDLTAFGGQTASYIFNYQTTTITRACPSGPAGDNFPSQITAPFLTSVVLPDGSAYSMPLVGSQGPPRPDGTYAIGSYDLAGSVSCKEVGALTHVSLPTGGDLTWEYLGLSMDSNGDRLGYAYPLGSGGRSYVRASIGVTKRNVKDADGTWKVWTYEPRLISVPGHPNSLVESADSRYTSREFTNTVTAPTGDISVHYFSLYPVTIYPSVNTLARDPESWDVAEYGLPLTKDPAKKITDGFGRNLFLSEQIFRAPRAGYSQVLMRSTYSRYETDVVPLNDGFGSMSDVNRRQTATETVYEDDPVGGGIRTFVETIYSDFDGLGHFRNAQTVSNFGPSQSRSVMTNYNPARGTFVVNTASNAIDPSSSYTAFPISASWILNTSNSQVTVEAGASEKKYFSFDSKGFLTAERTLRNRGTASSQPGLDPADILKINSPSSDGKGDLGKVQFYGGDKRSQLSTSDLFAVPAYPPEYEINNTYDAGILRTSQYTGVSFLSVDNNKGGGTSGIDARSGLVGASRDTAGVETDYTYDSMGRLTNIIPQQGGSTTHITYTPLGRILPSFSSSGAVTAARATVDVDHEVTGGSGTPLTVEEYEFDLLGRLVAERKRMPGGGWSSRNTSYNIMGWKTSVSEYATGVSTTYDSFDPFGRPGRIQLPDRLSYNSEGDHSIYLTYSGVRTMRRQVSMARTYSGNNAGTAVVAEPPTATNEFYDMLGRICDVQEPSGLDAQGNPTNVTTSYSYDVGGHLKSGSTSALGPVPPPPTAVNYARGGTATASSIYPNGGYPVSAVIDGDRKGINWANGGGGWNDATYDGYPDWVQVGLTGSKTINEIDVFTLQDNFNNPSDPTTNPNLTFTGYGITDFDVQYLSGSGWVNVPNGHVSNNNLVWRKFSFPNITTSDIRVVVNNAANHYSRVVEIEAWQQPSTGEQVWVEDSLPAGAIPAGDAGEGWNWVSSNPSPFSGSLSNQSNLVATEHQHYFYNATQTLGVNPADKLFAYVYLDPANPPSEVMLQWYDGGWEHRAYWGANQIPWGTDGTASRLSMGLLPAIGQWVRLEVPASSVGLEGHTLSGMAFSLYGGRASWDKAGRAGTPVGGGGTPPPVVIQTRTFSYDGRGFMTAETMPEMGVNGNGSIIYGNFDSMGNVGARSDEAHYLQYIYDAAGRLTLAQDRNSVGIFRNLKEFKYDAAAGAAGFVNGKLASATRHNFVVNPYNPASTAEIDVGITDTYSYQGIDGNISKHVLSTSTGLNFEQTYTYNALDLVAWQTYPVCTANGTATDCANSGISPPRTVGYLYDQGLLTGVTSGTTPSAGYYANAVNYNPNRTIGAIVHSNGVTDTLSMDPNNMQRPRSITTSGVYGGANWASGDYRYDGVGNIKAIGPNWYLYDRIGRLVEGTALEASNQKQTFSYDAFGNFTSVSKYAGVTPTQPNGPTGQPSSTGNLSIVSATNRLDYSVYDGAGNLRGLVSQPLPFTYDSANMIKYADPGRTFLYDASDQRLWILDHPGADPVNYVDTFTLRGLNNEVLREYQAGHARNPDNSLRTVWYWSRDYVYGPVGLLASETASGRLHYTLDHLGSPRLVTNNAAQRVEYHQYLPFGEEATPPPGGDLLKFTGHERDFNYDGRYFDYMHARFYGPVFGKFLSVDPARDVDLLQPQSWNLYAYSLNNPMRFKDSGGRYRTDFHRDLTGPLARATGYKPGMARAIAAATQGIDEHPFTNPFASTEAQGEFHFTTVEQRDELFNTALAHALSDFDSSAGDIGAYLHALGDSFSHAGFQLGIGHLLAGTAPDVTSKNPEKALRAAEAVYNALLRLNKTPGGGLVVPWETIKPYVNDYLKAEEGSKEKAEALNRLNEVINQNQK